MADINTARTIDVGDLIINMAKSKVKLPKSFELIPIRVISKRGILNPTKNAVRKFNRAVRKYDHVIEYKERVVERKRLFFGKIKKYEITATAIVAHD